MRSLEVNHALTFSGSPDLQTIPSMFRAVTFELDGAARIVVAGRGAEGEGWRALYGGDEARAAAHREKMVEVEEEATRACGRRIPLHEVLRANGEGGSDRGHGEVVVGRPAAGRAARVQAGGASDGEGGDCDRGATARQAGDGSPVDTGSGAARREAGRAGGGAAIGRTE